MIKKSYKGLKLGEILINKGLLGEGDLKNLLDLQKRTGRRIGDIIIDEGILQEKDVVMALSEQIGIPYFSLDDIRARTSGDVKSVLKEDLARQHQVVPVEKKDNFIVMAMPDPTNIILLDNLRKMTSCEINPVFSTRNEVSSAIDELYGKKDELKEAVESSYGEEGVALEIEQEEDAKVNVDLVMAEAKDATVVKLVDLLIKQAIKVRASDIHIEPFYNKLAIRQRIDGILYETPPPAARLGPAIISRIKILSNLDISERRLPQDGGLTVRIGKHTVDIRVATTPTVYGEKVVMRLLNKEAVPLDLKSLGLLPEQQETFNKAISQPYGLVFISGPTGSGKTTTLYAALRQIYTPKKNFLTVEDPVEYRLDGVNQVQIKPGIGLTFARSLRAFLRLDPDVIMVGEVRDLETAEICLRAALTGHLVFSTIHTNDAPTVITRMVDLGVEPYLLAPSIIMAVAQRLCRKLCDKCKEPFDPTGSPLEELLPRKSNQIFRARDKGCEDCNYTGYHGRIGIYETLAIPSEIKTMITRRCTDVELKVKARELGIKTLRDNGMEMVLQGKTSVEEVISVTFTTDDEENAKKTLV